MSMFKSVIQSHISLHPLWHSMWLSDNDTTRSNDESETINNNRQMTGGIETETDYLGCNNESDENKVDHFVNMMSGNKNQFNQCNSHEYSWPLPGAKIMDPESFTFFQQWTFKCLFFGKTTFAAETKRYVEVFVTLHGGPWLGRNCMVQDNIIIEWCTVAVQHGRPLYELLWWTKRCTFCYNRRLTRQLVDHKSANGILTENGVGIQQISHMKRCFNWRGMHVSCWLECWSIYLHTKFLLGLLNRQT